MQDDYKYDLALQYHDQGRVAEAIDLLVEILGQDPEDALAHAVLASCLIAQERLVAAEYELGIALGLDPNLAFSQLVRARLSFLGRQPAEAIDACDEALRLDPDLIQPWLLKASIFSHDEYYDQARQCLDEAARLAPEKPAVLVAFGDFHNARGEHQKAFDAAREALRIDAASEDANVLMGETQLFLGNLEQAEYHAKFAIMQNPNSEAALRLFVDLRIRRNWFTGQWWRINSRLTRLGQTRSALVLILGFLAFNLAAQVATDLGYARTGDWLQNAWLLIVLYSWIGIPMYLRALKKELSEFRFNPNF